VHKLNADKCQLEVSMEMEEEKVCAASYSLIQIALAVKPVGEGSVSSDCRITVSLLGGVWHHSCWLV